MLACQQVAEVRQLLADPRRLSMRAVARATGVSRATVAAIRDGRRPDYPERPERLAPPPPGPIGRCPSCGARCELPCRVCAVRAMLRRLGRRKAREGGAITLELDAEARARYDAIRPHKAAAVAATGNPSAAIPRETLRRLARAGRHDPRIAITQPPTPQPNHAQRP